MKIPARLIAIHRDYVGSQPCLVCGDQSTLHHVTGYADRMGRLSRREDRIVPLCPPHHQKVFDPKSSDPVSVEALGHRGFFEKHGVDLMKEAKALFESSLAKYRREIADKGKSCPFCKATFLFFKDGSLACDNCQSEGPFAGHFDDAPEHYEAALKLWNRRAA